MMIVMLQQLGNRLSMHCNIYIPGNEIPKWFSCRSNDNSVKIGLPPNWLNDEFMGIAICGVFTPGHKDLDGIKFRAHCCMDIIGNGYQLYSGLRRYITFKSDHFCLTYVPRQLFEHDRSLTLESSQELFESLTLECAHLRPLEYDKYDSTNSVLVSTSTCIHARFEFRDYEGLPLNSKAVIKSTGIRLVYKRDIECSGDDLPATDASILHQHHNCSTFEGNRKLLGYSEIPIHPLSQKWFRIQ